MGVEKGLRIAIILKACPLTKTFISLLGSNNSLSKSVYAKSRSVPSHVMSKAPSHSSIDYEQLGGGGGGETVAPSVSSSRSDSPMSENITGKCSSLLSLYMRNIETDNAGGPTDTTGKIISTMLNCSAANLYLMWLLPC